MKDNIPSGLKEEKTFDTHIQKHIAPMWGSLRLASVKYFIETGTVNGGFREALIAMMSDIILDYEEDVREPPLPNDNEVSEWFSENIDAGCSASSGIYKFRLWLKDRLNKVAQPPSSTSVKVEELAKEKYPVQIDSITTTDGNKFEYDYNEELRDAFKAGFLAASDELNLLRETIKNQHELILSGEKRGYEKAKEEFAASQKGKEDIKCKCKDSSGQTSVMCCNDCGLPTEKFWTKGK